LDQQGPEHDLVIAVEEWSEPMPCYRLQAELNMLAELGIIYLVDPFSSDMGLEI